MKMEDVKIYKIMEETCFGSLAFCCGLEKPCDSRSNVLKKLGLTEEDFLKLKKQFDENLIKLINKNER